MRPGIRRVAMWAGTALTLLIGTSWAGSVWYCVIHGDSGVGVRCVGLSMGSAWYAIYEFGAPGWQIDPAPRPIQCVWWFKLRWEPFDERMVSVPLWAPFACAAIPSVWLWWIDSGLRRRLRPGLCPACNYDRRGLAADAKCPECGTVPAPASK